MHSRPYGLILSNWATRTTPRAMTWLQEADPHRASPAKGPLRGTLPRALPRGATRPAAASPACDWARSTLRPDSCGGS